MANTMQPVDFDPATISRQKRKKLGGAFAVGVIYPLIFFTLTMLIELTSSYSRFSFSQPRLSFVLAGRVPFS
jgi:hypothetical protein